MKTEIQKYGKALGYFGLALLLFAVWTASWYWIGKQSVNMPEPTIIYESLPTVHITKDESELTPISAQKPDSIIYIVRYRDRPASGESAPPEAASQTIIDTLASYLATVEDWNVKRDYADTLFDSDTLGKATYRATVQYNKLTAFDFQYDPRQKTITTVLQPPGRLQPYALANATTQWASIGVGVKYGKIGLHVIGGYDYKSENMSIGGGLLVVF